MKRLLPLPAIGLGIVGITVQPSTADAFQWLTPGVICQPGKSDGGRINYNGQSAINESTTSSAKVYCALPLDSDAMRDAANFESVRIQVSYIDNNATSGNPVRCTLYGGFFGSTGVPIALETQSSPAGANQSNQVFTFFPSRFDISTGFRSAAIGCTLPPGPTSTTRSMIISISVEVS
jgi:hypothetical protein